MGFMHAFGVHKIELFFCIFTEDIKYENIRLKTTKTENRTNKMQKNDIYTINAEYIKEKGYTNLKSVYIPSVHRDYDTYTFCAIFYEVFGIICRIDRVQNTTSDDNFQSVFIYYYETKTPQLAKNRLYPINYVQKRTIYEYSFVKPSEFWVILPNKTTFANTTMTLDEISAGFDEMKKILDSKEMQDQDELDALMENRLFLAELYAAENTPGFPFLDTNRNIHQIAQNLKLMRERLCGEEEEYYEEEQSEYEMPPSNTKWEGYDEPEENYDEPEERFHRGIYNRSQYCKEIFMEDVIGAGGC